MTRFPFTTSRPLAAPLSSGAVLLTALGLTALPADAFSLFGVHLWGEKEPDTAPVEVIDPLPYRAALVMNGGDDSLQDAIRGSSGILRRVDQPALGRAGLLSSAKADYGRILDALYAAGHFGATVSITINEREVSSIPLDIGLPESPAVIIRVAPGPLYRFGQISVKNRAFKVRPKDLGLFSGEPALADTIATTTSTTLEALQRQGNAKPEISNFEMVAYNEDDVRAARERLVRLDTFRSVIVEQGDEIAPDGSLDMQVRVQDRKPRRIGAGVTISSLDGLSLEGFWLHRNLGRKARRVRVDGAIRGIGRSADPEDYDYEVGLAYTRPGTFNPDTEFTLALGAEQEITPIVRSLNLTTSATLDTRFNQDLTGTLAFQNERSITKDEFGRRYFSVNGIEAGLTFDNRDDALDPKRGYYLSGTLFPFLEFADDIMGVRAEGEVRAYRRVDLAGRLVAAGRLSYGFTEGVGIADAPPRVLFFAGGGGSVRGYDYNAIGTQFEGAEVGGRSRVEISGELRYQINDTFQIVGFGDAGLVGTDPAPDWDMPFRKSAGVGLRLNTGLGPIRLDLARAIDPRDDDPQFGFYIGLGQSF